MTDPEKPTEQEEVLSDRKKYGEGELLWAVVLVASGLIVLGFLLRIILPIYTSQFLTSPLLLILPVPVIILVLLVNRFIAPLISRAFTEGVMGHGRTLRDLRDQLSGELSKAQILKREGRFDEALSTINNYLDQDPDFPEAIFLRAQIYYDGFKDFKNARKDLMAVIKATPREHELNRWAYNFYTEIREKQSLD